MANLLIWQNGVWWTGSYGELAYAKDRIPGSTNNEPGSTEAQLFNNIPYLQSDNMFYYPHERALFLCFEA